MYLILNQKSQKYYAMKSIRKDVVVELNSISNIHVEKLILLQVNHPFIISMEWVFVKSYRIYFIMDYIRSVSYFYQIRPVGINIKNL